MESWRKAWREGFAPQLPTEGLEALRDALVSDDPRLLQGATTTPPPLRCVEDWPVEAADAIAFVGWQGGTLATDTVGDVEEFFARTCYEADQLLHEPAGGRWFLTWFDETPRQEMIANLLPEVEIALAERSA